MLIPERNKEIDTVDERMLNCIGTFHSFPLMHCILHCISWDFEKNTTDMQELNWLFIVRESALQIYIYIFKNLYRLIQLLFTMRILEYAEINIDINLWSRLT